MVSGTAADLVAAVSRAGGLGILVASGRGPAEIREQTSRIRALTAAPFGLNILVFYGVEATLETVLPQCPTVAAFAWPTVDRALTEVFACAHVVGAHVMHMVARLDDGKRTAPQKSRSPHNESFMIYYYLKYLLSDLQKRRVIHA